MKAADYTADQIVEAIQLALKARDFPAMESLIKLLAVNDPRRAREVFDTLELGVTLHRVLHPVQDGDEHG